MRFSSVEQSVVALLSRLRRAQKPPEDTHGRLESVIEGTGPGTRTTSYVYQADGYLASVTDALNRTVGFTRDADGRVLSTQLPDGRVVSATYDANSNLLTLTPAGRPPHSFSYTSLDLTEQYTPPSATPSGPTSYAYNADAQPTTTTRPDGDVVTSSYDLAGRLDTLTIPRGTFGYGYDGATGKLVSVTGPDGSTRGYTYQGAMLTTLTSGGPVAGSAVWTYDNNFRSTGRTVNGGNDIAFVFDADDLATAVGSLTLSRNAQNGLLTGTTLDSVTEALSYNIFAEISGYTASSGASQLYSESYIRDNLGRITQRTETIQGTTTTWGYSYDAGSRLSSVTRNGAAFESYTYDTNDNRLTKTTTAGTTTFAYDNQDRLLSATGPSGVQNWMYDGNGDLVQRNDSSGQTSFSYDMTGQLLSVTKPSGQVVSYDLDASRKRAVKKLNGVAQRKWFYGDGLLPMAEFDASGNLTAAFNGAYIIKDGTTYRLLRDHLGSVRLVVDASTGAVAQRLSYSPWGEIVEDTNPGFQPLGYAGGLYDSDTGFVRFGARDYDSSLGRWTCKDPLGLDEELNAYQYASSDPINYVDEEGLKPGRRVRRPGTFRRQRDLARAQAQLRWREAFGDEFYDIRGDDLVTGANSLYKRGFHYVPTTSTPCPEQRFWIFSRKLGNGVEIRVKYDQGHPGKREGPHWKIYYWKGGTAGPFFNHRGDIVPFDAQNAHMKAGRRGYVRGLGGNQYNMDMPPIYPEGTTLMHTPETYGPRMQIGPADPVDGH